MKKPRRWVFGEGYLGMRFNSILLKVRLEAVEID